jgi:hypothetical protein
MSGGLLAWWVPVPKATPSRSCSNGVARGDAAGPQKWLSGTSLGNTSHGQTLLRYQLFGRNYQDCRRFVNYLEKGPGSAYSGENLGSSTQKQATDATMLSVHRLLD